MAFRPQALFRAFQRHGLLCSAVYLPGTVATPLQVQLYEPDSLVLAGDAQVADPEIEFETSAIPALRRGDLLDITDRTGTLRHFRARAHAARRADGYFSRCQLEEI